MTADLKKTALTPEERERFARHLALPEIGEAGQLRLAQASVLVVGVGGLGSAACLYLAAAGIGRLGIVDSDRVELSNLQRQILHGTPDVGRLKVESACDRLRSLNPSLRLDVWAERFEQGRALEWVRAFDFVIDATDNFASKLAIARACHAAVRPFCYAGVERFTGEIMTVLPGKTACPWCLFDEIPSPCEEPAGPLGAVPGVMGALQACEAIKCILGIGQPLINRLLIYDALAASFRDVPVERNPRCAVCAERGRS